MNNESASRKRRFFIGHFAAVGASASYAAVGAGCSKREAIAKPARPARSAGELRLVLQRWYVSQPAFRVGLAEQ